MKRLDREDALMNNNSRTGKIIGTICIWIVVIYALFHLYGWYQPAFKREADIFATPFRLIPNYLNFDNFKEVLFGKYNYLLMILNSVKVTAFSVILAITTSILAGYGFAKLKFPGRDKIFLLYLATMMIPPQLFDGAKVSYVQRDGNI